MPVWQRFALTGGSRLRRLCAFAMLAALAVPGRSAGQQAQQAPPPAGQEKPAPEKGFPPVVESVDVSVTSVEVVVTDSKGNRVPGLTAADFEIQQDGITQKDLSRQVGVMEPTTFAAVKAMEAKGYVVRRQRAANRKNVYVHLTRHGRALERKLVPLAEAVNHIGVAGIDPRDVATTRTVLLTILANLARDAASSPAAAAPLSVPR